MSEIHDSDSRVAAILASAERVMTDTLGRGVRLGNAEVLRDPKNLRVLRCEVLDAPALVGQKVVVKRFGIQSDGSFDAAQVQKPWGGLYSEWAGMIFLESLGEELQIGPRCFWGDHETGLVVSEDLGDGSSLATVLQGDSLPEMEAGLRQYCASLGRLHAVTSGRSAELEAVWAQLGQSWRADQTPYRQAENWPRENAMPFREHCEALGVPLPRGAEAEAVRIWQAMSEPGPFLAFSLGDMCPDNNRLTSGSYVRFFDFECCGFRHAFLDGAYPFVPFPTCWCVSALTSRFWPAMSEAYRVELVKGCPEASDDEIFTPALANACASWMISAVSWNLTGALEQDREWGLASIRQRVVFYLENFVEVSQWLNQLPALRQMSADFAAKLRQKWEYTDMPLYQPLRG